MAVVAFKLAIAPMVAAYMIIVPLVLDMDQTAVQYVYFLPISYLLGSIPWGYLLTQTIKGMDVREYGSGSTGTSNVLRTAGGALAAAALVLDASKGVLAVLLARVVADTEVAQVAAGLAALVGHNWPIFLDFKGGRGIATGVGGLLMMSPLSAAIAIAAFLPITLLTRYLSLGSICAVITAFVAMLVLVMVADTSSTFLYYTGIGGVVIIWQHRGNIQRMLNGTENRLGRPARKISQPPAEEGQEA